MTNPIIAFDADDTLWDNEPLFRAAEAEFCKLMPDVLSNESISDALFKTEMSNLPLYGYGVKSFILSKIETAVALSDGPVQQEIIQEIIRIGKSILEAPITLIDGVEQVLAQLSQQYKLIVVTKGDLLDQEKKLDRSGLAHYFHHIEVVSEKKEQEYQRLLQHLDIEPQQLVMVGNSLKSDIVPVLNIGAHAFHVPYHTTWAHETIDYTINHDRFKALNQITDLLKHIPFS